jgi:beta-lactam-binding protein with PASTA domain
VTTLKVEAGETILTAHGFTVRTEGSGQVVVRQVPPAGAKIAPGSAVVLIRNAAAAVPNGFTVVPDVRGLSMRRAMNRLTTQHLEVAIAGSGNVTSQVPPPGDHVKIGTRIGIRCESRNLSQVLPY